MVQDEGDAIILLGDAVEATPLRASAAARVSASRPRQKTGAPPRCDLEVAKTLHTTLIGLIQSGLVKSAHDCSAKAASPSRLPKAVISSSSRVIHRA